MGSEPDNNRVVVVDVRMPFWSMVVFMVKWAIASIPALFILAAIGSLIVMLMGGMGARIGMPM
ncbi:MAG: hypothetical protein B7Z66_09000 [Chromatiales bacterium 21-64-14]|nr:MAG: hypothetical protein B7Z66_09000 [Chromatiales bacterium 21-64-14]HQU15249.1 hypothetical protein [Gammaproteobacteria bacterium]